MNITVIYGQQHRGNTWRLTKLFLDQFEGAAITEFFLPQSGPLYCTGCMRCINKGETYCPHAETVQPIVEAIDQSDLIVFASPCYVMNMTGQMKSLMEHLAYRFMSHRPEPSMFRKQGLVLSTAAGAGAGKTTKAIAENLFFWGVAKIYRYGVAIQALDFEQISAKRKHKIERRVNRIVRILKRNTGRVKPGLKSKFMFAIMKLAQIQNEWNPTDREHWVKHGWLAE
ncbi:MAG: flavodoxin family protein [Clostridiales bacterium]|jgi:multimeric flavodoxin WrbA|nr:flavodoxin family protein [Clostridiales bacterium]